MKLKRNKRFTKSISLVLTLWFTILTSNVLSAGSWLSPVAEGPSKDYADCQCCCAEYGGCSAECTCGGDPAAEYETAIRSCSGGATGDLDAFVWITIKFVSPAIANHELGTQQYALSEEAFEKPSSPAGKRLLKIPIAG